MSKINITREITKVFDEQKKIIEKAEIIALNRAAKSAVAQTVKFIREAYNIKASDLKNEIKITRANKLNKKVTLKVSHKAISLVKYGSARQNKSGVSVTVTRGKRQKIKSAFIAEVGKGHHKGVFKRVGKKRLPIKELYGPSAMQLMSSKQAEDYIKNVFYERFDEELQSAIKYAK